MEADLVDTMHVAVAPVELGRGERLWTSRDDLLDRFDLEFVPSPSGGTHLLFGSVPSPSAEGPRSLG